MTGADPDSEPRSRLAIDDVAAVVTIQAGTVVSKVIYRDESVNVTVFGFDFGEELTEHRTARAGGGGGAGRPAALHRCR